MGTLTVTFGTISQQATRSRSIPDNAFAGRIIPAFKHEFGANKDGPGGPEDPIAKTNAELMDDFFNQIERYLLNVVRRYEKKVAQEAVQEPTDLPLT